MTPAGHIAGTKEGDWSVYSPGTSWVSKARGWTQPSGLEGTGDAKVRLPSSLRKGALPSEPRRGQQKLELGRCLRTWRDQIERCHQMKGRSLAPNLLVWKKALRSSRRALDWESRGQDSSPSDLGQIISQMSVSRTQKIGV